MGESILVKRYRAKLAAERLQQRLQAEEAAVEELAQFRAEWLDRARAAAALGITVRTLKQWGLEGRGPLPMKAGEHRQSRCLWARADIDAFLRDRKGFEDAKRAREAERGITPEDDDGSHEGRGHGDDGSA